MRTLWKTLGMVAVAGCSLDSTVDPPEQHHWTGPLDGRPGWEQLQGNAGFVWTEGRGQFAAGIALSGDEAFALRPWHVHQGTCDERGSIVGVAGDYQLLVIAQDGTAQSESVIDDSLNPNRSYFVDVHLSEEEISTIIACAETTLQTEE